MLQTYATVARSCHRRFDRLPGDRQSPRRMRHSLHVRDSRRTNGVLRLIIIVAKKNQEGGREDGRWTKTSIGVTVDCCWRRGNSDTASGSSPTTKWMEKPNFFPNAPDSIATHGIMGCRRLNRSPSWTPARTIDDCGVCSESSILGGRTEKVGDALDFFNRTLKHRKKVCSEKFAVGVPPVFYHSLQVL